MKKVIGLFLLFVILSIDVYALEKPTHEALNENIANISGVNSYLINQLGFPDGLKTTFNEKWAIEWLKLGGKTEDEPAYTRSRNHFHNPSLPWDQAGLNSGIFTGKSSTLWIQDQSNRRITDLGGDWSWNTARKFYHAALTGNSTALNGFKVEESLFNSTTIAGKINMNETERNQFFAWTFRAVGQVMHLVEDMSVPSHTRNDSHLFYNYEDWVDITRDKKPSLFQSLIAIPVSFGNTIQNISNLFDTDQYNGTNPPSGNAIGLSEYTNANFFSEDTINNSNFPNPKISDTTTTIVERNFTNTFWNTTYPRQYYLKNCCGETKNGQGYLLSTVDFLHDYRVAQRVNLTQPDIPILDNNVYSDYASLLLPRAVGYSAGLLNYFFRGQINMDKDPNNSSLYVIKNESDEYMSGTFTLYYDDASGNRRYLTSWNKSINPKSVSDSVSITEPTDAKEKGKYILVFQGTLGSETGTVVGRIVQLKETSGRVLRYAEVYEGGAWHKKVSVVEEGRETPFFDLNTILQTGEQLVYRNYRSYLLPIMRFDRSDWNTFVVLIDKSVRFEYPYGSGSLSRQYYVNHYRVAKFHITTDYTIQYDGDIYTDTSAYYQLRSWVYNPHYYCSIEEERREQRESFRYVKINDIYMINGSLKLVYMVEEKTLDFDRDYTIPVDNEGRCSWTEGTGHSNSRLEVSQTLHFGGIIKTYSYTKIFNYEMFGITHTGGRYEYSDSNGVFISGEDISNAEFWILNSDEVLYLPLSTYSNGVYTYKYIILPGDSVLKVVTSTSPWQDWRYVFPSDTGFTFSKYAYSLPFYNPTVGGYSELLGDKFILLKGLTGFRLTGGNSLCLTKVTIDPALPKGYSLEDISPRIPVGNIVDYALN